MEPVITPYIAVKHGRAALDWYGQHFQAEVRNVIEWQGGIGHSEVNVAGAVFYLSDEAPDLGVLAPESIGTGHSHSIVLLVAALDPFVERAVAGGAEVMRPVEESHGAKNCWLLDPFGHRWNLRQPVVSPEQAQQQRQPAVPYYFTVTSPQPANAGAFFAKVFGWEYDNQANGSVHVENGGVPFGIRAEKNEYSESEPGAIDMWWKVYDFDDTLERVVAHGGKVVERNDFDSGREAQCLDDQGVLFRFSEPAPGYDS